MPEEDQSDATLREQLREALNADARRLASRRQRQLRWHRLRLWWARRRIHRQWKSAFDLYDTACLVALKAGSSLNDRYRPEAVEAEDAVFEALTRLHAQSCRVAAEVSHLMRGGFATGAYPGARTTTLDAEVSAPPTIRVVLLEGRDGATADKRAVLKVLVAGR